MPAGAVMLELTMAGDRQLLLGIERARQTVLPQRYLKQFGKAVYKMIRSQFDTFGASGNTGRWPANSPEYEAWKQTHYPGMPQMVLTGRLHSSITSPDGPDSLYHLTREFLLMGLDPTSETNEYARAHQLARGPAYRKQTRPRKVLAPTDEWVQERVMEIKLEMIADYRAEMGLYGGPGDAKVRRIMRD